MHIIVEAIQSGDVSAAEEMIIGIVADSPKAEDI